MSTAPATHSTSHAVVKYNDGEGVIPADFNDGQRFMQSRFTDVMAAGNDFDGDGLGVVGASVQATLPNYAYCPRMGQAILEPNGAGVDITPGMLGQRVVPATVGRDPRILIANVFPPSGGPHFVFDAGDGGNPRIDLIQMRLTEVDGDNVARDHRDNVTGALSSQLMDKKTNVQVEWGIVNGTPAASPAIPGATAGWVGVFAVRVPTSYSGAPAMANIYDLRMPMRVQQYRLGPGAFFTETAGDWTFQAPYGIAQRTAAGPSPIIGKAPIAHGRILGVLIIGRLADAELGFYDTDANYNVAMDLATPMGLTGISPQIAYTPTLFDDSGRPLWANRYGPHQVLAQVDAGGFPYGTVFPNPHHDTTVLVIDGAISSTQIHDVGFVMATDL